jgi:hypothetical protein
MGEIELYRLAKLQDAMLDLETFARLRALDERGLLGRSEGLLLVDHVAALRGACELVQARIAAHIRSVRAG